MTRPSSSRLIVFDSCKNCKHSGVLLRSDSLSCFHGEEKIFPPEIAQGVITYGYSKEAWWSTHAVNDREVCDDWESDTESEGA